MDCHRTSFGQKYLVEILLMMAVDSHQREPDPDLLQAAHSNHTGFLTWRLRVIDMVSELSEPPLYPISSSTKCDICSILIHIYTQGEVKTCSLISTSDESSFDLCT
jgi:hypothetical protein